MAVPRQVTSAQTCAMSLASELQRVKLDVRDAHDAIVTHENELRDIVAKADLSLDTAKRLSQRCAGRVQWRCSGNGCKLACD